MANGTNPAVTSTAKGYRVEAEISRRAMSKLDFQLKPGCQLSSCTRPRARFEKSFQLRCRFAAEARHFGNLFQRRQPEPMHRAKLFQQRRFTLRADAGKFIQQALGDFLEPQL